LADLKIGQVCHLEIGLPSRFSGRWQTWQTSPPPAYARASFFSESHSSTRTPRSEVGAFEKKSADHDQGRPAAREVCHRPQVSGPTALFLADLREAKVCQGLPGLPSSSRARTLPGSAKTE